MAAVSRQALLAEFSAMEEKGRGGERNFSRLLPYLDDEDFLIRCKAFLTLGRTGSAVDGEPLLALLEQPWQPYCHLMALDAYQALPVPLDLRANQLSQVAANKLHPTVQRGYWWVVGHTPHPVGLSLLADFVVTEASWGLKDEFLNEQWFALAEALPEQAAALAAVDEKLRVWLNHRIRAPKSNFGLYPAPDYLWQIAKALGVAQPDFRRIYYYPRQKHGKKQRGEAHIS